MEDKKLVISPDCRWDKNCTQSFTFPDTVPSVIILSNTNMSRFSLTWLAISAFLALTLSIVSVQGREYAYVYSKYEYGVDEGQFLVDNTYSVSWAHNGPITSGRFAHVEGTDTVTVQAGTYQASFYGRCYSDGSGFVITLDGVPLLDGGKYDDCFAQAIFTLTAETDIQVFNSLDYEVAIYANHEDAVYTYLILDTLDSP